MANVKGFGRGGSQVREDADIRRLVLGLDAQEAVGVPHVCIVSPNLRKAREIQVCIDWVVQTLRKPTVDIRRTTHGESARL